MPVNLTKQRANDLEIWRDIVGKLTKQYQIVQEDLYKIIAFWFEGWGTRTFNRSKKRWIYSLNVHAILDSRMGNRFNMEVGKAIRNCRSKLSQIDSIWSNRKGLGPLTEYQTETHELKLDEVSLIDNLLYGISAEDISN